MVIDTVSAESGGPGPNSYIDTLNYVRNIRSLIDVTLNLFNPSYDFTESLLYNLAFNKFFVVDP
jgi:hypothetical protein